MKLPSKKKIEATMSELEKIAADNKALTERENTLRFAIADALHDGEDGVHNTEAHGYQIKVTRKMTLTITKGALLRLEEEDPELYNEVTVTSEVTKLRDAAAKSKLDDLGDYVTMKQALPVVKITAIK